MRLRLAAEHVVEVQASSGAEVVRQQQATDEGAAYLVDGPAVDVVGITGAGIACRFSSPISGNSNFHSPPVRRLWRTVI
ncbi:MAG TPA: hypothetical protein VFU63_02730 [Ktedonobacterales bacterium]|nr:hypothetical protein [Ktedonobacterales bacterium]